MNTITQVLQKLTGCTITAEYRFHPKRRWRFDYAIIDHKVAIEIEGGVWEYGRHNRASGFLKDMEKYNEAAAMGWKLLRFTPQQILTTRAIELIKRAINH